MDIGHSGGSNIFEVVVFSLSLSSSLQLNQLATPFLIFYTPSLPSDQSLICIIC